MTPNAGSEESQPATPQSRFWDEQPCPRDICDGELQHQGNDNVMCLSCEQTWTHVTTQEHEQLVDMEFEPVAKRPRLLADGGREQKRAQQSTTPVGQRAVCPECDGRSVIIEVAPSKDPRMSCKHCDWVSFEDGDCSV